MTYVIVHYSEIALKGKNRPFFEKKLQENIKRGIRGMYKKVKREHDRIVIGLKPDTEEKEIETRLKRVFGMEWFAFAHATDKNMESIKHVIAGHASIRRGETAKIVASRSDKKFPLTSIQINRELGKFVEEKFGAGISMEKPAHKIYVNIGSKSAYIYFSRIKGPGGLPVGSSGKVLVLLSGGIDSAVAAYMAMKRGCVPYYLHFHAFRGGEEAMKGKIESMLKILAQYSGQSKIFMVPFHPFQFGVSRAGRSELIVFRRFMMQIAEGIARKNGMQAIVTGESLGQVASQTIENIAAIDAATRMPVFRPLISHDKKEIIQLAEKIDTYEISIKPYKDCCSIIARNPKTKAKLTEITRIEEDMDMDKLVDETLKLAEIFVVK